MKHEWEQSGDKWKEQKSEIEELERSDAAVIMDRLNWTSVLVAVLNDINEMIEYRDDADTTDDEKHETHQTIVELCQKIVPSLLYASENHIGFQIDDLVKATLRRAGLAIPEIMEDLARRRVIIMKR